MLKNGLRGDTARRARGEKKVEKKKRLKDRTTREEGGLSLNAFIIYSALLLPYLAFAFLGLALDLALDLAMGLALGLALGLATFAAFPNVPSRGELCVHRPNRKDSLMDFSDSD